MQNLSKRVEGLFFETLWGLSGLCSFCFTVTCIVFFGTMIIFALLLASGEDIIYGATFVTLQVSDNLFNAYSPDVEKSGQYNHAVM